jgi:glutathione S-transferase
MITLYGGGPAFGLPNASPFVSKTEIQLKMAGLPYQSKPGDFRKAPKGKIPYIEDKGRVLGDSTFIRRYLEDTYGVELDAGLDASQKAVAWAFEKMCEEHLYWAIVDSRWTMDADFDHGPRRFFNEVPAAVRPVVISMIRRSVRRNLRGQGFGRHTRDEITELARSDLEAISNFLGSKPWLMGEKPYGADAAVWSAVAGCLCPHYKGALREAAEKYPNLIAYRDRGMNLWFPELAAKNAARAVATPA